MLTSIISAKKNPLALLRMLFIEDGIPVDNLSFIHILLVLFLLLTVLDLYNNILLTCFQ